MACFLTYLWMRDIGASENASFISAVAYGLGGYLMSTINLTISLCSAAYFPLILLVFRRSLKESGFFWKGVTGVVFLFQFLAGDPAVIFTTFLTCALFAAYKTFEIFLSTSHWDFRYMRTFIIIGLVFAGLGAFQLFMFVEAVSLSHRVHYPLEESFKWSLNPGQLLNIAIPYAASIQWHLINAVRNNWLTNTYGGLTVITLSAAALFKKREKITSYFILLALLGIALSLGKHSPICLWLYKNAPLFSLVRFPQRFFFLTSFALACLAGLGFDNLKLSRTIPFLIVLALVVFDLGVNNVLEPAIPARCLTEPTEQVRVVMKDLTLFRVMGSPKIMAGIPPVSKTIEGNQREYKDRFFPNHLLLYKIYDALAHDSLYFDDALLVLRRFAKSSTETQAKFMDFLNIKYLSRPFQIEDGHVEFLRKTNGNRLYRNKGVMPRAYLVNKAEVEKRENILNRMGAPSFDPGKTIFIEEPFFKEDKGAAAFLTNSFRNEVFILDYLPNFVRMRAVVKDKQWLFLSDSYYPGWHVFVDDQPATIYRANYAFRAVYLSPGTHEVTWRYTPRCLFLGLGVSFSTLLALSMYCFFGSKRLFTCFV